MAILILSAHNVQLDPFFEGVECACFLVPPLRDCETFITMRGVSTQHWISSAPLLMLLLLCCCNVFRESDLAESRGSKCLI